MKLKVKVVLVRMYDSANYDSLEAATEDGAVRLYDLTQEVQALRNNCAGLEGAVSTYIQFAETAIDKLIGSSGTLAYEVEIKQEAVF